MLLGQSVGQFPVHLVEAAIEIKDFEDLKPPEEPEVPTPVTIEHWLQLTVNTFHRRVLDGDTLSYCQLAFLWCAQKHAVEVGYWPQFQRWCDVSVKRQLGFRQPPSTCT